MVRESDYDASWSPPFGVFEYNHLGEDPGTYPELTEGMSNFFLSHLVWEYRAIP